MIANKKSSINNRADLAQKGVRPQNQPTFKRDMVKFIYRFDVDFVSESSLWKMDSEITVPLTAAETTLLSENPHDLPIKIVFPNCNSSTLFNVNGKGFTLKPHTMPLTVDTQTFKITDNQGTNQNRYIDATAQLDEVYFRFGENKIICSPFADVRIFYYQLSNGEMQVKKKNTCKGFLFPTGVFTYILSGLKNSATSK